MLGGPRRAAIGGTALAVLASAVSFLTMGALAPAHAASTPCVVSSYLDVALDHGFTNQVSSGTWSDVDRPGVSRPRYGLYWPGTSPGAPGDTVPTLQAYGGEPAQTGDAFQWRLRATCGTPSSDFLDLAGHAVGFCGRAVGVGSGTLGGKPVTAAWDSTGASITFTDPSLAGTLHAQYDLPGSASTATCVNGTEIKFPVTGVVTAGS